MKVKLTSNGYSKIRDDKTISIVGNYEDDEEVTEWLGIEGNTIEPEFTNDEMKAILTDRYKGYYLEVWNAKLKECDYDSIATVNAWIGDDTFGAEAQALSDWYKSIVLKNYEILNAVNSNTKYNDTWVDIIPTKDEYLAELPTYTGV